MYNIYIFFTTIKKILYIYIFYTVVITVLLQFVTTTIYIKIYIYICTYIYIAGITDYSSYKCMKILMFRNIENTVVSTVFRR